MDSRNQQNIAQPIKYGLSPFKPALMNMMENFEVTKWTRADLLKTTSFDFYVNA